MLPMPEKMLAFTGGLVASGYFFAFMAPNGLSMVIFVTVLEIYLAFTRSARRKLEPYLKSKGVVPSLL